MDNTKKLSEPAGLQTLSLCTGTRGIERGIERTRTILNTVAYVEIEAFIIANLVAEMEKGLVDAAPIWTNLKTFNAEPFRGKIHLITGGYPCQPFSVAGKQQGENDPRHLWSYIREIVRTIQPVCCFFENVEGHLNLGYDQVYRDLRSLGYRVEAGIFSAEEVGAPHSRKRLFILAFREELGNPKKWYEQWNRSKKSDTPGKVRRSGNQSQKLGNPSNLRLCGLCKNSGTTRQNKEGKECGVYEFKGTSSPSRNGTQREHLANAECIRYGRREYEWSGFFQRPPFRENKPKWNNIRCKTQGCCGELAYTSNYRFQGIRKERKIKGSIGLRNRKERHETQWPARPGHPQHQWEEPRTLSKKAESEMGITVNGYKFRTDLLRALGNGVMEQTAEIAWITLWEKHFDSIEIHKQRKISPYNRNLRTEFSAKAEKTQTITKKR